MSESDSIVCAALPVAMQPKGAGDEEGSIMIHENCTNESFFSHSAHYDSNDVSLNERLNALLLDPRPLKSSVQTELPWLASKQTLRTPPPTASNAEWNRREAELAERERSLRLQSSNTSRVVNFPSCYPLLRHDITNDIPTAAKSAVSFSYATCKALLLALLVTLASEIVWHFSTLVALNSLVLAIVYVFIVPPFVFVFSHLRLYHAVRHNSSLNFYGYFMATTVTSIFILFMTVGVWPENGHGGGIMGIIRAISDHQIAAAITACVTCSMMFVVLLMNMYTTALAVKYYSQATMDRFSPPEAESIRRSVVVERHAQV